MFESPWVTRNGNRSLSREGEEIQFDWNDRNRNTQKLPTQKAVNHILFVRLDCVFFLLNKKWGLRTKGMNGNIDYWSFRLGWGTSIDEQANQIEDNFQIIALVGLGDNRMWENLNENETTKWIGWMSDWMIEWLSSL